MAERVKPRSREAVRLFPQGFTRDDSPGEDEWWPRACELAVAVWKKPGVMVRRVSFVQGLIFRGDLTNCRGVIVFWEINFAENLRCSMGWRDHAISHR